MLPDRYLFVALGLTLLLFLHVRSDEHGPWSCPLDWTSYTDDHPYSCLRLVPQVAVTMKDAHSVCVDANASLIMINSEKKLEYFKSIVTPFSTKFFWLGMQRIDGEVKWLTKTGSKPATPPKQLIFNYWYDSEYDQRTLGFLINAKGGLSRLSSHYYSNQKHYLVCEKELDCSSGWYGVNCDQMCHCHGELCDPSDRSGTCHHGCETGWMGPSCNQQKEESEVTYYCLNSLDRGAHVLIRIKTKSVPYDVIQPLDQSGEVTEWCNESTTVTFNAQYSTETIRIEINEETDKVIQSDKCPGAIRTSDSQDAVGGGSRGYEWRVKMQEREGYVSRNDKEFTVHCKYNIPLESTSIAGTVYTVGKDKPPVELKQEEDNFYLEISDAFSGLPLTNTSVGNPVVLKVRYDSNNEAKGIVPYSCTVSSADGTIKQDLINEEGCPVVGSPVSAFYKNDSTSLITQPFPMMSFESANNLQFHCSFYRCFDDDACFVGCDNPIGI